MHLWFERKIPESANPHIDQAERWMIDANVAAALRAITTITDVAALESAEEFGAFGEAYIFFFPQCERAHRRGGITPAVFAVTITHLQRFAAQLDLHCSAVTSACMCICHGTNINQELRNTGSQSFPSLFLQIESQSLPSLLRCYLRSFTFYLGNPFLDCIAVAAVSDRQKNP
jgi:hypothetical protein